MERYEQREQIKANIDYDYLSRQCPYDDVESLLEAKGYKDCVAYITGEECSVVVA